MELSQIHPIIMDNSDFLRQFKDEGGMVSLPICLDPGIQSEIVQILTDQQPLSLNLEVLESMRYLLLLDPIIPKIRARLLSAGGIKNLQTAYQFEIITRPEQITWGRDLIKTYGDLTEAEAGLATSIITQDELANWFTNPSDQVTYRDGLLFRVRARPDVMWKAHKFARYGHYLCMLEAIRINPRVYCRTLSEAAVKGGNLDCVKYAMSRDVYVRRGGPFRYAKIASRKSHDHILDYFEQKWPQFAEFWRKRGWMV